jgi:hypothetical protein
VKKEKEEKKEKEKEEKEREASKAHLQLGVPLVLLYPRHVVPLLENPKPTGLVLVTK